MVMEKDILILLLTCHSEIGTERPLATQTRVVTVPQSQGAREGRRPRKRKERKPETGHARADAAEASQKTIPTLSNDNRLILGILTGDTWRVSGKGV